MDSSADKDTADSFSFNTTVHALQQTQGDLIYLLNCGSSVQQLTY